MSVDEEYKLAIDLLLLPLEKPINGWVASMSKKERINLGDKLKELGK